MQNEIRIGLMSLLFTAVSLVQGTPILDEMRFNINGMYADEDVAAPDKELPSYVVPSQDYDHETGIGKLHLSFDPEDSFSEDDHYFIASFFDYDIDYDLFFKESAHVSGTAKGLTWEIDEPSYDNGDILENFSTFGFTKNNKRLVFDNTVFSSRSNKADDVSVAMGWDVTLRTEEYVDICYSVSQNLPDGYDGFHITHINEATGEKLYYTTTMKKGSKNVDVPEPATGIMLLLGCIAMGFLKRKRNRCQG